MTHIARDACPHFDASKSRATSTARACADCGLDIAANLRLCVTCGYVGCCESQAAHDTAHYEQTGHPLITPHQASADWLWCYACKAYLD